MLKISDVIISVETNQLIKDPYIKNGSPIYDNGQILHYSGGFAVVFPFQINSEKWAFRCWTSSVKNVDKHLKALSKEMEKNKGYGLSNVYKRIKYYYGEDSDMDIISSEEKGTEVAISIKIIND